MSLNKRQKGPEINNLINTLKQYIATNSTQSSPVRIISKSNDNKRYIDITSDHDNLYLKCLGKMGKLVYQHKKDMEKTIHHPPIHLTSFSFMLMFPIQTLTSQSQRVISTFLPYRLKLIYHFHRKHVISVTFSLSLIHYPLSRSSMNLIISTKKQDLLTTSSHKFTLIF